MPDSSHTRATVRSVTKTVRITCDPRTAFEFLADLGHWPQWAVVNIKSTRRSDDPDWWEMVTPRGSARIRMRADARNGILDHDFVDSQASWTVPARVIANGSGCAFQPRRSGIPVMAVTLGAQRRKPVDYLPD